MPISLDAYLGNLPTALQLRAKRTEMLAANLANADTPKYKARDFDFQAALGAAHGEQLAMNATRKGHLPGAGMSGNGQPELQYRIPDQPSLDGNTVDTQLEKSHFSQNAVQYQATMTFLDGKLKGLMSALRGE